MFRDFKLGGYSLEGTMVNRDRLISLILLITLAYSFSTFTGQNIKQKGVAKYVFRFSEPPREYPRHSDFTIGLSGTTWLDNLAFYRNEVKELTSFTPHKQDYYRQSWRAASLIQSAL